MNNLTSKIRSFLLLGLGLMVIGVALCAQAQVPTYFPQVLVGGIALTAGSATNLGTPSTASYQYGVVADVRKQAKVLVEIVTTNALPDAVNANILYYQRSVIGSSNTFENTLNPIGWTTTATAVNPGAPLVILTNLDTLGCGYIKFPYLTNVAGSGTNIGLFQLYYGIKIQSP